MNRASKTTTSPRKSWIRPTSHRAEAEQLEARRLLSSAIQTFNFSVSHFVEGPNQSVIYATEPANNMLAVIDATTLQVTNEIPIGSNPTGLALSSDGSTLYVADSGSSFIQVVNTSTLTEGTPITLTGGQEPQSVQIGTNNRLWVLTSAGIEQINDSTGASTGPNLSTTSPLFPLLLSGGDIKVSSDGDSLYYGMFGSSPSYLYKFDVSGTTPTEIWAVAPDGNGQDVELSHNNNEVILAGGGSNTVLYRSSDATPLGTLNGGAANAFAFSPDDAFAYSSPFTNLIDVYNLSTFVQTTSFATTSTPRQLFVDNTAQYLFASETNITEVFSTGRDIPVAPVVVLQPQPQTATVGATATFTAGASGSPTPSVQWQISTDGGSTFSNISGATNTTYTTPATTLAQNGDEYRAVFTNAAGSATSNAAALTVVVGPKLAIVQQPGGTVPGSPVSPSFIVDLEGPSGNVLTGDNSLVTLSIVTGPIGAILEGTDSVNAVNGVAIFSALTLPVAGQYTLEATDGTFTPVTSSPFTIQGPPPEQLVFVQQPTTDSLGSAISPAVVVDLEDESGNLLTTNETFVTLSIATGPNGSTLGGGITVQADQGIATFNTLVPSELGTYTLRATDAPATAATSLPFQVVNPGAVQATTTVVTPSQNPATAGGSVTFTATVSSSGSTPGGSVQFFDGTAALGVANLSNGSATLTTSSLPVGNNRIFASYLGDATHSGSSSVALPEMVATAVPNAPDLVTTVTASQPLDFVPGNPGSVEVTLTNQGTGTAKGVVGIQLYASPDGQLGDAVLLPTTPRSVTVQLKVQQSKNVVVSFTVPAGFNLGTYTLIAQATAGRGLTSDDISTAPLIGGKVAQASFTTSFGAVGGRRGIKVVENDPSGAVITYRLTGPGTATLNGGGSADPSVVLTGTTAASVVSITTQGGTGHITLGALSANSSVGSINAPQTTLIGVLDVAGTVGRLVLAGLTNSNLAASNFGTVLIQGNISGSRLLAGTSFGANGVPGGGDDTYAAGTITSIRVTGSVNGSIIAAGLNPVDGTYLNGNDTLIAGGAIKAATVTGALGSDSYILATSLPKKVLVGRVSVATATDPRFAL